MCEGVEVCPGTGLDIENAPCKQIGLGAFEIQPKDRVAKLLKGGEVTEEDVLVLSEQGLRACDIAKLKAMGTLNRVNAAS